MTLDELITLYSNKYGVDEKLARCIIQAESSFKPDATNTKAKRGIDKGFWQINSFYWEEGMSKQNFDINIPNENLEAGFYLLHTHGTKLWNWSKTSWSKCYN